MIRRSRLLGLGALALCLAACSQQLSWPDQTNANAPDVIPLAASNTVGQTFVALEAGLNGVDIYLTPQTAIQGDIQFELLPAPKTPGESLTLASASLPAEAVAAPGFYHFAFSPQGDSRLRSYYLRLTYPGPGTLLVGHGSPEAYPQGALYRNDSPDDGAQMAFRLDYAAASVAAGVAWQGLTWLGWLGLAGLLFVLPGWALFTWLWPKWGELSWGEQLGLAIGLSLAVYPILFLAANWVGLRLGWLLAVLPVVLGLTAVVARGVLRWRDHSLSVHWPTLRRPHLAADLAFAGVAALVFFTRMWAARGLSLSLWGDSYQHTVIAQLLVDQGGLFSSWVPYAEISSLTYHFGFHTLVAVFHWLSGLDLPSAVLWVGQILNGLSILTLYPLALKATGQRWAGVGALLVAGLLSPMPMAYVNWGRYTQLAGQTILPVAVVLAWVYFEDRPAVNWRLLVLGWLAWGGLALTHYRIIIFAVVFATAFWLVAVAARQGRSQLLRTAWLGLGSGAIFLPWFLRTFSGGITTNFIHQLSTPAGEASAFTQQYNSLGDLATYLPVWLWLLVAVSLGWSLWRRDKNMALLGVWWGLLLLAADPQWVGLPGEGAISNFALLIAAYLPAGILAGAALGWLRQAFAPGRVWDLALLALVAVVALLGSRQRLGDVHAGQSALVTAPDQRAAAWIDNHVPADARFLVNSFAAYGGNNIVGADAGWWLPLLAHRATNVPPLNYAVERGPRPDYRLWTNALPAEIQSKGIDSPEVLSELAARGIGYVYIGQLRGQVNNPGQPLLVAGDLAVSPHYRLIYHQDRVWVFQVSQ